MKQYPFFRRAALYATAAFVAAGCERSELAPPKASDSQIEFAVSLDGQPVAQPRAAGVDTDLKANGFYLAGYYTTGLIDASAATAVPNIFNKEVNDQQIAVPLVTYTANGNGGKFVLKTIKWALNDITYLSFFGWSQSKPIPTSGITAATTGIIGQTKDDNDKGYPWVDIRNADAPADQTDVVGSRSLDHKNDAVISSVDLDFRHLLSKLTFKAKSSSKANIAITAVNIKYAADKVRKKARYTFSSNAAAIGAFSAFDEYHSGTVALGTTYPAITEGAEVVLGSALLLPQQLAAGDVSIEIKYKLSPNSGNIEGPEQTKILPLAAFTFEQGNNYLYAIDMQATEVFVPSYPIITNWEIVAAPLPVVAGAMDGKTLLLLDGYDKPYIHTDGKAYWLDRSGYNRHVELTANNISYDVPNRGYVFKWTKGGDIPNLVGTQVAGVTIDMVAEGTANGVNQQPFYLEPFFCAVPKTSNVAMVDWGSKDGTQQNLLTWTAASGDMVRGLSYWNFTYGNNRARIFHNAMLRAESTITSLPQTITEASLAHYYSGRISYLKITNEERGAREIAIDYVEHKKRYNIDDGLPKIEGPKGDVKLLLVGDKEPYTHIDGNVYWLDYSGYNNHMLLSNVNGTGIVTHDASAKCYQFNPTLGQRGSTLAFPTFPDATIEICSKRGSASTNTAVLGLSSVGQLGSNNLVRVLTGLGSRPNMQVTSFGSSYLVENISNVLNKQLWTIVSSNSPNTITVYQNANSLGTQTMTTEDRLISSANMTCDVVGFHGDIHYIRITSKAKNQSEVTAGHNEIQQIFNY